MLFFFFKQKTAYEMRISDWSSDVCSSDLAAGRHRIASGDLEHVGLGQPAPDEVVHLARLGQVHDVVPATAVLGRLARDPGVVDPLRGDEEIVRESCRERVCQSVSISVVGVSFKKKTTI